MPAKARMDPLSKLRNAALCFAACLCLPILLCMVFPFSACSEDEDTVLLARVMYTLTGGVDTDAMEAVGTVIMNRAESPWYPDTVEEVILQAGQFPCGSRFNEASLSAARAVLGGTRTLPTDAVDLAARDSSCPRDPSDLCAEAGDLLFYRVQPHRPL